MGVVLKTNINALVKKYGNNVRSILHDRVVAKLSYLGEAFIKEARSSGNYNDDTGNLRSSISYVVLYNGDIVNEYFELHNSKGEKGLKEARKTAKQMASRYSKGYVLICMAGMEYAIYLELRGYNVISSGEVTVRRLWSKMFSK